MVQRTTGSLKNWVITYLKKREEQRFKPHLLRALSALVFVHHSEKKLTSFEAHHGREENTV